MNDLKQVYEEIAKKVEDGSYFEDAKNWYCRKYLTIYTQHAFSLLLFLLFIMNSVSIYFIAQMNYEMKKVPFAIYATDPTSKFPRISKLNKDGEDMMVSISRYLVSYYTNLRESYNPEISKKSGYDDYLHKVHKLSSRQVYNEFLGYIEPNSNPDSPILQYRDSMSRKITIKNIEFMPYSSKPDGAIVEFRAQKLFNGEVIETRDFAVEVIFDINVKYKLHQMNMVILSYRYLM